MAIVQSFGALQSLTETTPAWAFGGESSLPLYGHTQAYGTIYARQPNVRTCVDFLARNIAELALHAFRRVSDTDRERLPDHDLVRWLDQPNPSTRRYRLMESLVSDLAIYFNAYWLKVPWTTPDGDDAVGLLRLPPEEMRVEGGLLPRTFCWTRNGRVVEFTPNQLVFFSGYNPLNPLMGLSPLETLRRILAEEDAAGVHREAYWRHASRMDGVIQRPLTAPKWSKEQKNDWREQWQLRFAGSAGAGMVAVLEDGMTFQPTSFSPKDSEYLSSRKLTREECAAEYQIPLPFVGILDHATFSNIKEQHKHLYQDCLGPWLRMIKEEIEGQLLVDCDDRDGVYTEFNISAKLAGSFEEQAQSLQMAIGRPYMTANEGRARLNLPAIVDDPSADELAEQQGGPALATPPGHPTPAIDGGQQDARVAEIIQVAQRRQSARLQKLPSHARATAFFTDLDRWNRELATDLTPIVGEADAGRLAGHTNVARLTALAAEES